MPDAHALAARKAQVKVSEARVAQAQATVAAAEAESRRPADNLKRYESVESRAVSKSAFDLTQTGPCLTPKPATGNGAMQLA
jgi:multidrug resistance efflux pump